MQSDHVLTPLSVQAYIGVTAPDLVDHCARLSAVACPSPGKLVRVNKSRLDRHCCWLNAQSSVTSKDHSRTGLLLFTGRPFFRGRARLESAVQRNPLVIRDLLDGRYSGMRVGAGWRRRNLHGLDRQLAPFFTPPRAGPLTSVRIPLGLLLQILPTQPRLNQVGVAAQLLGRSQIFDETHFEGVFRLPARHAVAG